ncbi:hypothetical protein ACWGR4_34310 [Embleya sp. NPDC055664]
MGEVTGRRTAFAAVGALGTVALLVLVALLPPLPSTPSARPMTFRDLARLGRDNKGIRADPELRGGQPSLPRRPPHPAHHRDRPDAAPQAAEAAMSLLVAASATETITAPRSPRP